MAQQAARTTTTTSIASVYQGSCKLSVMLLREMCVFMLRLNVLLQVEFLKMFN